MQFIQPSFTSGELSPELTNRVDITKYASGLKTARNAIVGKSGGVFNRPGSFYIAGVKDSTKKVRLISFEVSSEDSYQLEFGPGYFRFFKNHGAITATGSAAWDSGTAYVKDQYVTYNHDGAGDITYRCIQNGTNKNPFHEAAYWTATTIYEIENPYAEDDIFDVKFVQSADVMYLVHRDYAPRQLIRYGDNVWTIGLFPYINGPFMLSNSDLASTVTATAITGNTTLTASKDIFNADHVGALWRIRHWMPALAYNATRTTAVTGTALKFKGTWHLVTSGTWTGTLIVEKSTDGGSNYTELASYASADDFNIDTYGLEDDVCLVRVRLTISSGTITINHRTEPYQNIGIALITGFTSTKVVSITTITDIGTTGASSDWAEGSWSEYRGYPGVVMFYQDRLAMVSNTYESQGIWLSKTSNYVDFGISDPLVDSDAISIILPSRKLNAIRNTAGLKQLMALTANTVWSVKGTGGIITPSTVQTDLEEYRGSGFCDPVMVGNRIIFIQPIGSTLRELNYDYQSDSFSSSDISILSEHLFKDHTIVEACYQQEPYSLVYCVRDDGIIVAMTYMRDQEVLAWTWFDTDGLYESVSTIPGEKCNEVWAIVNRDGDKFIEYWKERTYSTDPADQYYVDCGYTFDEPEDIGDVTEGATTVITIEDHPFTDDDIVEIIRCEGLEDGDGVSAVNGLKFIVDNSTTDTFEILNLDGTAFDSSELTDYISGGEVRLVVVGITGLDWLEDREVAILADGNVLPRQTVADGAIDLSPGYSRIQVGLPYLFDIETLKPELQLKDGTMQGKKIKLSKVILRVLNSRGGYIGPDEDHLVEFIQRQTGGTVIPLVTGEVTANSGGYYNSDGTMLIRQVDPLPITVLALIPEVSVGG